MSPDEIAAARARCDDSRYSDEWPGFRAGQAAALDALAASQERIDELEGMNRGHNQAVIEWSARAEAAEARLREAEELLRPLVALWDDERTHADIYYWLERNVDTIVAFLARGNTDGA